MAVPLIQNPVKKWNLQTKVTDKTPSFVCGFSRYVKTAIICNRNELLRKGIFENSDTSTVTESIDAIF
jgi:hypothetical protein